jgi:ectoine hydroxylase-related dioxygenase (phytanoyl-CoA dioxygenase family)
VLDLVDRVLEPNYLLSAALAIDLGPGEDAQKFHYDDGSYHIARPRPPVGVSAIWAVDEFTEANGATEVIPGSHRWGDERPGPDDPPPQDRDAGRLGRGLPRHDVAPRRRQHDRACAPGDHPAVLPAAGAPA